MRTFVELDAELVFDVRLLGEVVLVELRADDVAEGGALGERVGGRGDHGHGGGEERVEDDEDAVQDSERTLSNRMRRTGVCGT